MDGLIHFHIIFFLPKYDGDDFNSCLNLQSVLFKEVLFEWRRNVAPPVWSPKKQKFIPNRRCPEYKPLCTYVRRFVDGKFRTNYDLHYVNPRTTDGGTADVAFYVLKYMMKPSDRAVTLQRALALNLPEEEYNDVWSLVKPRYFGSLHFGLAGDVVDGKWKPSEKIVSYVKECVEKSKRCSDFPQFVNPVTGQHFPLSRYYKSNGDCYSVDDSLDFFFKSRTARADNVVIEDDRDVYQYLSSLAEFSSKVHSVELKEESFDLDLDQL